MEFSEEISNVSSSRLSLAEAISQLQVAKQAFQKAENLHKLLEKNQIEVLNIRNTLSQLVHITVFNNRMDDQVNIIEKAVKSKFEDFSSVFFSHLHGKVSKDDLETFLAKKVDWKTFNTLSQQVSSLQARLNKHISTDFESFKTKIKLELANKAEEVKNVDETNDGFLLKAKVLNLERKINEIFMEDSEYESHDESNEEYKARHKNTGNESLEGLSSPQRKNRIKITKGRMENRDRGNSMGSDGRLQRRGSKDSVSCVAGSRSTSGPGGLKGLSKKLSGMQKDLESNKQEIEDSKKFTEKIEEDLGKCNSYIESVEIKVKETIKTIETMEENFIRALRRKGLEKKSPQNDQPTSSPLKKDLEAIDKKFEDRLKRIITIESDLERVDNETKQLKKLYKDKLSNITSSLKSFEDFKVKASKDLENFHLESISYTVSCDKSYEDLLSMIYEIKGPLNELISNQQKANETLSEELRRHQELFRALVEEHSASRIGPRCRSEKINNIGRVVRTQDGFRDENNTESLSPDVHIKNKFYQTNSSIRSSPLKIDSSWASSITEGKMLSLPRVSAKEKLLFKII
ncbi:hypothetical protein SteCoe_356 [Stentor coeruleus]|uniref:Uncharacterized protein n=1 Tax=Stentor coeruleus TaxID=5963 RepID=A0A1R2D4K7_9CILI|nr:hypothetical protein SteCoe_356 [Stentor coeruleus]